MSGNQNQIQYLAEESSQGINVYPPYEAHTQTGGHKSGVLNKSPINNLLLEFSQPILTLMIQIKHTVTQEKIEKLQLQIVKEFQLFRSNLTSAHYPRAMLLNAACYCLCAAFDEAVLNTPWGPQSVWVQQSLLNIFYKETWGGKRFYIILNEMLKEPERNVDILELNYFLLSLGFEGMHYGKGSNHREMYRKTIINHIRALRSKPNTVLSLAWQDQTPISKVTTVRQRLKKRARLTGIILVLIVFSFNASLYFKSTPIINKLNQIAVLSPVTVFSQVLQRPIINRFSRLKREE